MIEDAQNSSSSAKAKSSDHFHQLQNHLYHSIGATVLLTKNFNTSIGLVNGSTSTVKKIVLNNDSDETISDASNLFVWVDFGDQYSGPTLFSSNEPEKMSWFPIFAKAARFQEGTNKGNKGYIVHERIMLPLKLSWSWTIHKSQGQTIKNKIVLELGNKFNSK